MKKDRKVKLRTITHKGGVSCKVEAFKLDLDPRAFEIEGVRPLKWVKVGTFWAHNLVDAMTFTRAWLAGS